MNNGPLRCGLLPLSVEGKFAKNAEQVQNRLSEGINDGAGLINLIGVVHMSSHAHALPHPHKHSARQQPAHVAAFVNLHVAEAKAICVRTGIPAEVILAQSALESDWGRTVEGNAYFGIKGKSPTGNSIAFSTHEVTLSGLLQGRVTQPIRTMRKN